MEICYDLALVSTQLLLTDFDRYKSSEYAEGDGGGRLNANRHVVVPCPQAAEAPHRGRRWAWPAMRKPSDCQDTAKRVCCNNIFPRTTSTQAKGITQTPTHARQKRKKLAWPRHFPIRAVTGHACDHSLFVTCQAVLSCHRCSPIPIRQTSFQVLKSLIFPTHRLW